MPEQNHELAIEILEGTLELKNAEVYFFCACKKCDDVLQTFNFINFTY